MWHTSATCSTFESAVKELFAELVGGNSIQFEGVSLSDLPAYEKKLELNINVFELVKKEENVYEGQIVQRTHYQYADTMNLNLYEDHFSLIINLDQYCQSFSCWQCGKLWKWVWTLQRHEHTCTNAVIKRYVGGSYQHEPNVFEQMANEAIMVDQNQQFYPYCITYDFECYFDKGNLPHASDKLEWQAHHVPLSASVYSNVPGFKEPQCFITNGNPDDLVMKMIEYMHTIQETATALQTEEHQEYYNALIDLLHSKEALELMEASESMMEDKPMEDEQENEPPQNRKSIQVEDEIWTVDVWDSCDWIQLSPLWYQHD